MKRILTLALVASLGLVACSKDKDDNNDNNSEKSVVGVWVSNETSSNYTLNGITVFDSTVSTKAGRWEFKADGTLITSVNAGEPDPLDFFDEDTLYYTYTNSELKVKEEASWPSDSAYVVQVTTLTDSKMNIENEETEVDGGTTSIFKIAIKFDKL